VAEKLYVSEFASPAAVGVELGLGKDGGLVVGALRDSAEALGCVEVGDAVHPVNGASIHLLPPAVAAAVLANQHSPVLITLSTVHTDKLAVRGLASTRL
jgi:hypothetical protein